MTFLLKINHVIFLKIKHLMKVNLTFDDDIITMITWVVVKAPLLILSILPVAGGPIGFVECMGAMIGRTMGEIILLFDKNISVGKFTLAGAASMGVAIT